MTSVKDFRSSALRLSLKSGALIALTVFTTPVLFAQGTVVQGKAHRSDVVEQKVHYSDLDLNSTQNQLVLVSRVKKAADKVCNIIYSGQSPMAKFESRCTQTVYREARPQIDLAIANANTGTRVAIALTSPRSR